MTTFGDRLKDAIFKKGLSQKNFSEICTIKPYTINRYITNQRQPDLDTLAKMAKLLGISIEYLLYGETNNSNSESTPKQLVNEHNFIHHSSSLTNDEIEIIRIYRSLTEKNKGKADLLLEQLAEQQKNNMNSHNSSSKEIR